MRLTLRTFRFAACATCALAMLSIAACTTQEADEASTSAAAAAGAAASTRPDGLSAFQVEHGIGPVTAPLALNGVDEPLAEHGEEVFEQKCASCHKMAERYVGPALGDVTKRRSPAFVMNMMLNPQGMVEKHPEVKKLLAEFYVAMPNQNLSPDEARQVLEYLRSKAD
jgi:cytochrome c2